MFKKVDCSVSKLLKNIAIGEIGLPDIQRLFVWDTTRVRDLSMYRGYPIDPLLFWENGYPGEHCTIGVHGKQKAPHLLIVDGQQGLTALYTVMKGEVITDQKFRRRHIRIVFSPLENRLEVTNTAIEREAS